MNDPEREDLLEDLVERLRAEGVPEGSWLVDITAARQMNRDAYELIDGLLARLQDALVASFDALS